MNNLKSAPRGSSPGPGGWTYEQMRVLLVDADTFNLFFEAASSFAQASLPGEIAEVLMGARLTALAKPDGGARHRHRTFNAEDGRQDPCETIRARVREGMRTISIRIVDQGWDGRRRTHAEGSH